MNDFLPIFAIIRHSLPPQDEAKFSGNHRVASCGESEIFIPFWFIWFWSLVRIWMCDISDAFRFDRFDVQRREIVRPIETRDERNLFGVIRPYEMNDIFVD